MHHSASHETAKCIYLAKFSIGHVWLLMCNARIDIYFKISTKKSSNCGFNAMWCNVHENIHNFGHDVDEKEPEESLMMLMLSEGRLTRLI